MGLERGVEGQEERDVLLIHAQQGSTAPFSLLLLVLMTLRLLLPLARCRCRSRCRGGDDATAFRPRSRPGGGCGWKLLRRKRQVGRDGRRSSRRWLLSERERRRSWRMGIFCACRIADADACIAGGADSGEINVVKEEEEVVVRHCWRMAGGGGGRLFGQ